MKLKHLLSALPLLLALLVGTSAAQAQEEAVTVPDTTASDAADVNAEARTQYAEAIEAARAAGSEGTAEAHIRAAEQYLAAAELAAASGDAELEASASGALSSALKAHADAGGAYSSAGDYANAAAQFDRAAAIAERLSDEDARAQTLYNAAVALVTAEQFADAVQRLETAIELAPENLNYLYVRGAALSKTGDVDAAAAAYADLAARAEESGDAEMVAKARDSAGKLYLLRARDALQADNYGSAIAALNEAAKFFPEDDATVNTFYANAYYKQGVAQVRAENLSAAQRSLQQAQAYGRKAGRDQIVNGAQQQLDYIRQVQEQQ